MRAFETKLGLKFVLGTAIGLLASSLVFLLLYMSMYKTELEQERAEAARQVSSLLQSSLENAMLKRDLDGLRDILEKLGTQSEIYRAFITNPAGEIRFSSHPELLGRQRQAVSLSSEASTQFLSRSGDHEILRSMVPVRNKPACIACHGPVQSNPINGALYIDYEGNPIISKARNTTLLLMGAGSLIVLINIIGGWWFIQTFVLNSVNRLAAASRALSAGNLSARTNLTGNDELAQLGTAFDDMAQRLQTKVAELEQQRGFLQALVDAIPDGIRVIDNQYKIHLSNAAYHQQIGLDNGSAVGEMCYKSSHGRNSPCPANLVSCPLAILSDSKHSLRMLDRHVTCRQTSLDVEVYAAAIEPSEADSAPHFIVESIRDLSKDVRFSHDQKLSELGRLASGIAHEIHNPLFAMRLALQDSREALQEKSVDHEHLDKNLGVLDREMDACITITQRLLKLSMARSESPELVDLSAAVRDTLDLLAWEAELQDVEVSFESPDQLWILGHDSELRMLTLNIAQNAFHAMADGGELRVRAAAEGEEVILEFQDSGAGIAAQDIGRIFEPFFSRRADGVRGVGLGLSICRTIVRNHGGVIEVLSTPGAGACFRIVLPSPETRSEELS